MALMRTNRTFAQQLNPWGRQGGPEPQRNDLWLVWFTDAVQAIKAQASAVGAYNELDDIHPYEVRSVQLPEQKVGIDFIKRDSRSYAVPGSDEPLDPVRMTFIVNATPADAAKNSVIAVLSAWRALVRAGRGRVSVEPDFTLNADYRVDYAFDVLVQFLRGGNVRSGFTAGQIPTSPPVAPVIGVPDLTARDFLFGNRFEASIRAANVPPTKGDFAVSYSVRLINLWLAAFGVTELKQDGRELLQINATFGVDDLRYEGASVGSMDSKNMIVPALL